MYTSAIRSRETYSTFPLCLDAELLTTQTGKQMQLGEDWLRAFNNLSKLAPLSEVEPLLLSSRAKGTGRLYIQDIYTCITRLSEGLRPELSAGATLAPTNPLRPTAGHRRRASCSTRSDSPFDFNKRRLNSGSVCNSSRVETSLRQQDRRGGKEENEYRRRNDSSDDLDVDSEEEESREDETSSEEKSLDDEESCTGEETVNDEEVGRAMADDMNKEVHGLHHGNTIKRVQGEAWRAMQQSYDAMREFTQEHEKYMRDVEAWDTSSKIACQLAQDAFDLSRTVSVKRLEVFRAVRAWVKRQAEQERYEQQWGDLADKLADSSVDWWDENEALTRRILADP